MVRLSKMGPGGMISPGRATNSLSKRGRTRSGTNAGQVFYEDRSCYVVFQLKGSARGSIGNRYKMILRMTATNKFRVRVWDQTDTLVGVVNSTTGMGDMAAAIAGNSDLSPIIDVAVTGTINETTQFSAGTGIGSATNFYGGS